MALLLPDGAIEGLSGARTLAGEPERLRDAYLYWRQSLNHRGLHLFEFADTVAGKFVLALPDETYDTFAFVRPRRHLFDGLSAIASGANLRSLRQGLTLSVGCPASGDNIAKVVNASGTARTMIADLEAFAAAAIYPELGFDEVSVARGIYYARELHDRLLAHDFARVKAEALGMETSELLSLHMHESAMAITPSFLSLPHGPVVKTGVGSPASHFFCRSANVLLNTDPGSDRPGFCLRYPNGVSFPTTTNAVSQKFGLAWRNLAVMGGLDSIVLPNLDATDELEQFLSMAERAGSAAEPIDRLRTSLRADLSGASGARGSQQTFFDSVLRGLAMRRLDILHRAPDPTRFLFQVEEDMRRLIDMHHHDPAVLTGRGEVQMVGEALNGDTEVILDIQTDWYYGRSRPETLAARKDRSEFRRMDRFSPFLTYMRYNMGDAAFIGTLLRTLVQLTDLKAHWVRERATLGSAFPDAMDGTTWGRAEERVWETHLRFWRGRVGTSDAWRHMGLFDEFGQAAGGSLREPVWMTAPRPNRSRLVTAADTVDALLRTIKEFELQPALEVALEFTPMLTVFRRKMTVTSTRLLLSFGRAHKFTHRTRLYADHGADGPDFPVGIP